MIPFLFICLILMLMLGFPIFISLTGASLFSLIIFTEMNLVTIAQKLFGGIDRWSLMAIPFFILAATAMDYGGMAKRILNLANALVGEFKGGLALTTVVTCLLFGALAGSAPATIVAIGTMLYPAMIKKNYESKFSIGLLTSSGSIALLIPPSLTIIVYGAATGVSVGALFMAGFGAGTILAIPFIIYSLYYAHKNNIKLESKKSLKEKIVILKEALWALGVPIIIIGGIYLGVFTPTEAAAVSAIYAILVCVFIYKDLSFKELYIVGKNSAKTTAMILIMIAGAMTFSWVLTLERVPQILAAQILNITDSRILILILMNIIMLIAGMFVDGSAFILILAPLFLPIANQINLNPVHLGIIMVANGAIGMYTPPFGLNLFVGASISDLPYSKVISGILPFIIISLIALAVITYLPQLYMWVPELVY